MTARAERRASSHVAKAVVRFVVRRSASIDERTVAKGTHEAGVARSTCATCQPCSVQIGPTTAPTSAANRRVLERTAELAKMDVTQESALTAAPPVDRDLLRDRRHVVAFGEPPNDDSCRLLVRDEDVSDEAGLRTAVPVAVADVVGAHFACAHPNRSGRLLHEPGHGVGRGLELFAGRPTVHPGGGPCLVGEDGLGDELLDHPPTEVGRTRLVAGGDDATARPTTPLSQPVLQAREQDRPSTDGGDARLGHDQPLTPPTVIPSTK